MLILNTQCYSEMSGFNSVHKNMKLSSVNENSLLILQLFRLSCSNPPPNGIITVWVQHEKTQILKSATILKPCMSI